MTTKTKVIIAVVSLATAAAFGRFTAPEKIKIETKIVEVEKKTSDKEKNNNEHKKTVIVKHPDGSSETTITDDKESNSSEKKTSDSEKDTSTSKEVTRSSGRLNLSVLGGVSSPLSSTPSMVYGGHVSKTILGPISIGLWGLTNSTFGASIGLDF